MGLIGSCSCGQASMLLHLPIEKVYVPGSLKSLLSVGPPYSNLKAGPGNHTIIREGACSTVRLHEEDCITHNSGDPFTHLHLILCDNLSHAILPSVISNPIASPCTVRCVLNYLINHAIRAS